MYGGVMDIKVTVKENTLHAYIHYFLTLKDLILKLIPVQTHTTSVADDQKYISRYG